MADAFIVTVKSDLLQQRFSESEGRQWTADDLTGWLNECGFRYRGGGQWLCEEIPLDVLARDEYRVVRPA